MQTTIPIKPKTANAPETIIAQPTGEWRRLNILTILVLGVSGIITIVSIGVHYDRSLTLAQANRLALVPLTITPATYAFLDTLFHALSIIILLVASLLLLARRSNAIMSLLTPLALGAFGGGLAAVVAYQTYPSLLWRGLCFVVFVFSNSALLALILLFPNGQFVPRWSRFVLIAFMLFDLVRSIGLWFPEFGGSSESHFTLVLIFLGTAFATQAYRYRRAASPVVRQQMKWVLFGIGVALLGACLSVILGALPMTPTGRLLFNLFDLAILRGAAFFVLVASLVVSISYYHLWQVDLLLNRSVVAVIVTLILSLIFTITALGFQVIVHLLTGSGDLALLSLTASALVIGGLFLPMRRAVYLWVDRYLFGLKVDFRKAERVRRQRRRQNAQELPTSGEYYHRQLGSYQLGPLIGRGGMGEVYEGKHVVLGRQVAVKVLSARVKEDEQYQKRFEREARIIAALQHPNIVEIFDYGMQADTSYMVMELLSGQTLSQNLSLGGQFPLAATCNIVDQIASALDYAHERGLIHRDVKPSNIMLQQDAAGRQRAVLMDFGIAKIANTSSGLTQTGTLGTLDYIAPEQISSAESVGQAADIYALAVVVYQMLTGELPFKGAHVGEVLFSHLHKPAPDPRLLAPELPHTAAAAIMRALSKVPEDRYPTAGHFAVALRETLG